MTSTSARRERVERGVYRRPGTTPPVYETTWTGSDGRQCWRTIDGGLREARAARGGGGRQAGEGQARRLLTDHVSEYAAEWIEAQEGRLRPKTLRGYRDHLRLHVEPRLGKRRLTSITVDDLAAVLADRQRAGYAGRTIRGTLTVLSRLFGSAARRGLIPSNPRA
jgi:Phage integrase, N-terminal SAM-like domain